MTIAATPESLSPATAVRLQGTRMRRWLPALVGVAFSVSWIAALTVGPGNLAATADGGEVVSAYTGHLAAGAVQYVLSEGLPAAGLAVVGLALAAAARRAGRLRASRTAAVTSLAAALVSLTQCLLGLLMVLGTVPDGSAGSAHLLFETVNRMDGVKMFALAVLAMSGAVLAGSGVAARWLRYPAYALAATIAASGVGYLLLLNGLTPLAYLSLPLLLLWVTGSGITLSRRAG